METQDVERALEELPSEKAQPICLRTEGKRAYLFVKRAQDIALSALALVLLSPLMLLIALAVVVDDPQGGPIFSQIRCGRGGEPFRLYKFRTMCVGAEERLNELLPHNEIPS